MLSVVFAGQVTGDVMRPITVIGACLAVVAGIVVADAQGIGYGPGVNPSNPQDLTHRSNPQDRLAPGGSNPQDLFRRPPNVTSVPASRSLTPAPRYTTKARAKAKAKAKAKRR